MPKYELVFSGSADVVGYKFPRYRRFHRTVESAQETVYRVAERLDDITSRAAKSWAGTATECHNPILYGPGCGDSGRALRLYRPDDADARR